MTANKTPDTTPRVQATFVNKDKLEPAISAVTEEDTQQAQAPVAAQSTEDAKPTEQTSAVTSEQTASASIEAPSEQTAAMEQEIAAKPEENTQASAESTQQPQAVEIKVATPAFELRPEDFCERPGELLKQAREAKGISIEKVAEDLNFLPSYISCLENEDFKPLHNTTFVKGYLRSYSRYLNIDSDKVISCLAKHHPDLAMPEQRPPVNIMSPEKPSTGLGFKLLSVLVVITILAIIVLWWQSSDDQLVMSNNLPQVKVETLEGTVNAMAALAEESRLSEFNPLDLADRDLADADLADADAASLEENLEEISNQAASELVTNQVLPLPTGHKNGKFTGNVYATTANAPDRLGAIFADDCWVEIRDVNKKIVYAGSMRGKEQLLVTGKAPFRAILGRSVGVKLVYQGKNIDFSDKIRPNGYAAVDIGS